MNAPVDATNVSGVAALLLFLCLLPLKVSFGKGVRLSANPQPWGALLWLLSRVSVGAALAAGRFPRDDDRAGDFPAVPVSWRRAAAARVAVILDVPAQEAKPVERLSCWECGGAWWRVTAMRSLRMVRPAHRPNFAVCPGTGP
ncbi:hypothetical protein [Streptomyces sp. 769]|uniref:hypothetical protein n=1 Tax=Streptomyces sp. 769 TaxID=1262452 RepID=UPI00131B5629|nr:hypothetical protein [Streptomyces sp. 769]